MWLPIVLHVSLFLGQIESSVLQKRELLSETVHGDCDPIGSRRAHPKSCQKFQICVEGVWKTQPCDEGTVFDDETGECLKGKCDANGLASVEQGERILAKGNERSFRRHRCSPAGKMRQNPDNCGQFQWCVHGNWITQNCPAGLVFDEKINNCNWGKCPVKTTTTATTTTTTTAAPPIVTAPQKCEHGDMWADKDDCHRFKTCVWGNIVTETCPGNLVFDEDVGLCNYGNCDGETTTTTTTTTTQTPTEATTKPPTKPPTTVTETTTEQVTEAPTTTAAPPCRTYTKRSKPGDCSMMQFCSSNQEWVDGQRCAAGTVFSETYGVCLEGQCAQDDKCEKATMRAAKDCRHYELCWDGSWLLRQCSTRGMVFYEPDGACTTGRPCVEPDTTESPTTDKENRSCQVIYDVRSKPDDCTVKQTCLYGKWVDKQCAEGQVYSAAYRRCMDGTCAEGNECEQGVTRRSKGPDCNKYDLCWGNAWIQRTCSSAAYIYNEKIGACIAGTCEDNVEDRYCSKPWERKLNPDDCHSYLMCFHSLWTRVKCAADTHYDPQENFCLPGDCPGGETAPPTETTKATEATETTETPIEPEATEKATETTTTEAATTTTTTTTEAITTPAPIKEPTEETPIAPTTTASHTTETVTTIAPEPDTPHTEEPTETSIIVQETTPSHTEATEEEATEESTIPAETTPIHTDATEEEETDASTIAPETTPSHTEAPTTGTTEVTEAEECDDDEEDEDDTDIALPPTTSGPTEATEIPEGTTLGLTEAPDQTEGASGTASTDATEGPEVTETTEEPILTDLPTVSTTTVEAEDCPSVDHANMVIAIDKPGFISKEDKKSIKHFLKTLKKQLPIGFKGVNARIYTYTESASTAMSTSMLYKSIKTRGKPVFTNRTSFYETFDEEQFRKVADLFAGVEAERPKIFFLFTDGRFDDPDGMETAADELKISGIKIMIYKLEKATDNASNLATSEKFVTDTRGMKNLSKKERLFRKLQNLVCYEEV